MRNLYLLVTLMVVVGCGGEKKDEMGPYVTQLI